MSHSKQLNGRDERNGQFLLGHRGLGGRPKGSRAKLSEKFLKDIYAAWRKHGVGVVERVIHDDPSTFLRIVAHVLPRELDTTLNMNVSILAQIEDFNEAYRYALAHIGSEIEGESEPELIEVSNGNGTD